MSVVVTTNTSPSVEDDLPEAWAKTIKRLEDNAQLNLSSDRKIQIEDITAIINPPKADPTTKTKIKNIFAKALRCIDRFGGMIAQAGSIVFGPSAQVYNAVSFLIKVSQGVKEVFDNVTALMTRLSIFLDRLAEYLDRSGQVKLEKAMRKRMYDVLENFISVMVLSYRLTHRWKGKDGGWRGKVEAIKGKVKVIVNVGAFGDDSGVKAAIDGFERAVADLSDVQIDMIQRDVSAALLDLGIVAATVQEIRTDTQEILSGQQEMRAPVLETASAVEQLRGSDDAMKADKDIRKLLGFGEKEDLDGFRKAHDEYASQIAGTGSWLLEDHHDFQRWKNVRSSQDTLPKIFMIQAPEGFGKSHLSHAVIDHLQTQSQALEAPLTTRIAWHYFSKDSKPVPIIQAFKQVIWQLSKIDTSYAGFLKTVTPLTNVTAIETWTKLVADYSAKRRPNTMFS